MKNFMFVAVLMCGNLMAGERTILKDSKEMPAEINNETVFCSSVGYGFNEELKINIKALDGWTIMDHSNSRFGNATDLPCMTAGFCKDPIRKDGLDLDVILQNTPRTEKIIVHRELIESRVLDENKICQRSLTEKLNTVIAGIPFKHQRRLTAEQLPESACTF